MIYVKDAARCHILLMNAKIPPLKSRAFNLGSGEIHTFQELAEVVKKIIPDAEIELTVRPSITRGPSVRYDLSKAYEEFGYKAQYDLESGVRDYIENFKQKIEKAV